MNVKRGIFTPQQLHNDNGITHCTGSKSVEFFSNTIVNVTVTSRQYEIARRLRCTFWDPESPSAIAHNAFVIVYSLPRDLRCPKLRSVTEQVHTSMTGRGVFDGQVANFTHRAICVVL